MGAIRFFFMITTGYVSDKIGRRGPVCFAVGILLMFCYAVLTAWNVPNDFKMAMFILIGCYGCYTPLLAGWINSTCGHDQQLRAFVLGIMVTVGQAVVIHFQQYQLPSGQAPQFKQTHEWGSALAFVIALTLWTGFGIDLAKKWFEKRRSKVEDVQDIDTKVDTVNT